MRPGKTSRRGVSLVDSLMAVVLTATCLTPILNLMPGTQRRLGERLRLSAETRAASRVMDEQMALAFSALTPSLGQSLAVDTGEETRTVVLDVEPWDLDGDGEVEADCLRLSVRVGQMSLVSLKVRNR